MDVYDADVHSPAHYFMLKRVDNGTSAETVPAGGPNRYINDCLPLASVHCISQRSIGFQICMPSHLVCHYLAMHIQQPIIQYLLSSCSIQLIVA